MESTRIMLPPLPNSTTVLVLGILSIVACWCIGIVGLAFGIIALVMSGRAAKVYMENPGQYSETSYKNMQAGKICAIVGTCISSIFLIYMLFYMLIFGTIFSLIPWSNIMSGM